MDPPAPPWRQGAAPDRYTLLPRDSSREVESPTAGSTGGAGARVSRHRWCGFKGCTAATVVLGLLAVAAMAAVAVHDTRWTLQPFAAVTSVALRAMKLSHTDPCHRGEDGAGCNTAQSLGLARGTSALISRTAAHLDEEAEMMRYEQKNGGISVWEVVMRPSVNVRSEKSISSKVLETQTEGALVIGRKEDEDWVALLHHGGYMKTVLKNPDVVLLKRRPVTEFYNKVETSGSCKDDLKFPILDEQTCEDAALLLGMHKSEAGSWTPPSTAGCYFKGEDVVWVGGDGSSEEGDGGTADGSLCSAKVALAERSASGLSSPPVSFLDSARKGKADSDAAEEEGEGGVEEEDAKGKGAAAEVTRTGTFTVTLPETTTKKTTTKKTTTKKTTTKKTTETTTRTSKTTTTTKATTVTTTTWGWPSLFCFLVMRNSGYEPGLVKAQLDKHVGIFACDDYNVFSTGRALKLSHSFETVPIDPPDEKIGNLEAGQRTNSWLNTATFMEAWQAVKADGRFYNHDWVVKADPDAVFFPDRLRTLVKEYTENPSKSYYFLNCNKFGGPADLYGSIEVFSQKAVGAYLWAADRCKKDLPWQQEGWGEDYFMQRCCNDIDVHALFSLMVGDDRCVPASCTNGSKVGFHDFKNVSSWFKCWKDSIR